MGIHPFSAAHPLNAEETRVKVISMKKIQISLLTLFSVITLVLSAAGFGIAGASGSSIVYQLSCILLPVGLISGFIAFTRHALRFIRRKTQPSPKEISLLSLSSGVLFLLAAAGFITFRIIGPRFDENGALIEPFFLIPMSWLLILIAVILGFTRLAVQFTRAKK